MFLVRDYVEGIKDVPELLDMLAAPKDINADKDKIVYDEVMLHITNHCEINVNFPISVAAFVSTCDP